MVTWPDLDVGRAGWRGYGSPRRGTATPSGGLAGGVSRAATGAGGGRGEGRPWTGPVTNAARLPPRKGRAWRRAPPGRILEGNETVSRIPASPAFQSLQPPGPGGPTGRVLRCGRPGVARPVRTRPSPCRRGRQRRSAHRLLGAPGEDSEPVLQADQALRRRPAEAVSVRTVPRPRPPGARPVPGVVGWDAAHTTSAPGRCSGGRQSCPGGRGADRPLQGLRGGLHHAADGP